MVQGFGFRDSGSLPPMVSFIFLVPGSQIRIFCFGSQVFGFRNVDRFPHLPKSLN